LMSLDIDFEDEEIQYIAKRLHKATARQELRDQIELEEEAKFVAKSFLNQVARAKAERDKAEEEKNKANKEKDKAHKERDQANAEKSRAEEERNRAEEEKNKAEEERSRAEEKIDKAVAEKNRIQEELHQSEAAKAQIEQEKKELENKTILMLYRNQVSIAQIAQNLGLPIEHVKAIIEKA